MDKWDQLLAKHPEIVTHHPLAPLTTTKIGGPTSYFIEVTTPEEFVSILTIVMRQHLPYLVIGGGSNLLIADHGFEGLTIKNSLIGIKSSGKQIVVQSGTQLQQLVDYTIDSGLAGIQRMTGIPGTVGGAIYGNAEAYQQCISDYLIKIVCFDGQKIIDVPKSDVGFSYRDSDFKRNGLVILSSVFQFNNGDSATLAAEAKETLTKRLARYPTNLLYPGSFFKNVRVETVPLQSLKLIPEDKIRNNRIYVGYLLESIGSHGRSVGKVKVTDYHGNLLINIGSGTAEQYWQLAHQLAVLVKKKFNIKLEPEVQFINLPPVID